MATNPVLERLRKLGLLDNKRPELVDYGLLGPAPNDAQRWCYWCKRLTDDLGPDQSAIRRVMVKLRRDFPHAVRYLVDGAHGLKWGKELQFRDGSMVTMRYDQPGVLHASKGKLVEAQPVIFLP